MRASWVVVVSGLACGRPVSPVEAPVDGVVHIAVVGDRTGEPDDVAWRRTFQDVERLGPDLVLSVGDVADDTLDPDDWARALAAMDVLSAPVAIAPGNHDIIDEETQAVFERQTGQARYRSFDFRGVHVVIVDNSIAESWDDLSETQRTWLAADLAAHTQDPVLVVMHRPFWALTIAAGEPDPMHDLFVKHKVDGVFCGHWHRHFHQVIDGVPYTNVGTSGGGFMGVQDVRLGTAYTYVWAQLGPEGLRQSVVEVGRVHDVDLLTSAEGSAVRALYLGGAVGTLAPGVGTLNVHLDPPEGSRIEGALQVDGGAWAVAGEAVPVALTAGEAVDIDVPVEPGDALFPMPRITVPLVLPDAGPTPVTAVVDLHRELVAPKGAPVVVDGVLAQGEWAGSAVVTEFTDGLGRVSRADATTVYLRHDGESLFLGAVMADRTPERIKHLHHERDGAVEYDDRIGMQFSPADQQVFWFYVNPNGAVWDVHGDRVIGKAIWEWDAVEAAATMSETGWSMEARVPFSSLGIEGELPQRWRFDLRRKQEGSVQAEATFTPQFSSVQPDRQGVLILGE